jgi:SAM-dependent methyltransferase/4-amino-4-deoxy-L-arabinose transferase-like glycosyltransferase
MRGREARPATILFFIIFLGIVIRAAVFSIGESRGLIQTYEYETIAQNLINGRGFLLSYYNTNYYAAIAPLFPWLCSVVYSLFGHHQQYIIFLQIALNAVTCYIVFKVACRIFNQKAALVSAFFTSLHPGLIVYSSLKLHSLSLYTLLICGAVYALIRNFDAPCMKNQVLAGAIFGLGILERPPILALLPFSLIWWLVYHRDKKLGILLHLRVLAIALLVASPWIIRNAVRYKNFFLVQHNQWENLWIGNNPRSSGTLYLKTGVTVFESSPQDFKARLYGLDEAGQVAMFKNAAFKFIRDNPLTFFSLTVKKFFYFWWFSPQTGILYPPLWLGLYKRLYAAMLFLAFLGFLSAAFLPQARKFAFLLLAFFFSLAGVHSFYYCEIRHRWSIEPLLMIFSAFGLFALKQKAFCAEKAFLWRRGAWGGQRPAGHKRIKAALFEEVSKIKFDEQELNSFSGHIFHPICGAVYRKRFDLVYSFLPARCNRILEVGFGPGVLIPALAQRCDSYCGIDIHREAHKVRAKLEEKMVSNCALLAADAYEIPFKAGVFDVILCQSVLEHLRSLDKAIAEIKRVLKDGGRLILGFPVRNRATRFLFSMLGYDDRVIHPSGHEEILRAAQKSFFLEYQAYFPSFCGLGSALYFAGSFKKL